MLLTVGCRNASNTGSDTRLQKLLIGNLLTGQTARKHQKIVQ